ncbi:hypothetical protein [Amycolatopsis sp. FDAARGOS 1241]|uniref:hypothetical protein n=1 Tax=Amycolatopsis sp. FDAARGOS 1241 TaxID=2778070 RepID=UPI0019510258|nr:hypothetical protein [Amycolatopsis sp. FDAARGOS 1241]QRP42941.1 hypothetical protein I6J71_26190 [Amycolatopsis sp. FDAARGOS 1241]
MANLLPGYVAIEQVLVLEYARMGLISDDERRALGAAPPTVTADAVAPEPEENFSDIAFALERHVGAALPAPVTAWHVNRNRNDCRRPPR